MRICYKDEDMVVNEKYKYKEKYREKYEEKYRCAHTFVILGKT